MQELLNNLPTTARDIKLNFSKLLQADDGLWNKQERYAIMYAASLALPVTSTVLAVRQGLRDELPDGMQQAADIAMHTMAMNNVYYRFVHLAENAELARLPAGLRMQQMAKQPAAADLFEAMSLAISSINGCGMCIKAHNHALLQHGKSLEAVQEIARMAAVLHAVAWVQYSEELQPV